ncbi:MAG: hypothetical protein BWX88_03771 [Planctomycetes bacterium ADurb.Bin126]|nr:MAG: hypothetical protein BWX88_03771 [Planctomycetes bacterium ADurb.Bin126]HOD84721.1 hypothetical protein [Phycisphaerae bacterium]HQL75194.1 hypothetical protein [Phycisphaerae bacterium]
MPRAKDYDESALILALAAASESAAAVARRLGLSPRYVQKIAARQARLDLQPRIAAARRSLDDELRRQAVPFARELLAHHIRLGLAGDGETARRCREFVLTHLHALSRHDRLDRQAAGRLDISAARFHLQREKLAPDPRQDDPAADAPFKYYSYDDWMLHNYMVADPKLKDDAPDEESTVVANCDWGREPELIAPDERVSFDQEAQGPEAAAGDDAEDDQDPDALGRKMESPGARDIVAEGNRSLRRAMRAMFENRRPRGPQGGDGAAPRRMPPGYHDGHVEPPPPDNRDVPLTPAGLPRLSFWREGPGQVGYFDQPQDDGGTYIYDPPAPRDDKLHFTPDDYRKRVVFRPPFGPPRFLPYVLARRIGLLPPDFE